MDFPWGSNYHKKFITNVGLITSDGKHGPDIMAAEWTYLVSYSPAIIAVSIGKSKATADNILETKKFGVSLASEKQSRFSSIAGGSSGRDVDKIAVLKEMGAVFEKGEKTGLALVKDSTLQAECEVINTVEAGNYYVFFGHVLTGKTTEEKSLALHDGAYWKMTTLIEKPSEETRTHMKETVEKHRKD